RLAHVEGFARRDAYERTHVAPAVFELFEEALLADARDGLFRAGVEELRAVRDYRAHLLLRVLRDVHDERGHDEPRVCRVRERGHPYSALPRLLVVATHRGEPRRLAHESRGVRVVWVRVVPVRREYDLRLVSSYDSDERRARFFRHP